MMSIHPAEAVAVQAHADVELTAMVAAPPSLPKVAERGELLLTNRWILQPRFEIQFAGKADPDRQTGAGLMTTDAGLRVSFF